MEQNCGDLRTRLTCKYVWFVRERAYSLPSWNRKNSKLFVKDCLFVSSSHCAFATLQNVATCIKLTGGLNLKPKLQSNQTCLSPFKVEL